MQNKHVYMSAYLCITYTPKNNNNNASMHTHTYYTRRIHRLVSKTSEPDFKRLSECQIDFTVKFVQFVAYFIIVMQMTHRIKYSQVCTICSPVHHSYADDTPN